MFPPFIKPRSVVFAQENEELPWALYHINQDTLFVPLWLSAMTAVSATHIVEPANYYEIL